MKTIQNNRILKESAQYTDYMFGIHSEDLSHIFSVLRNQMYSDKILAVIREYSTNAYDAHVEAGIKDIPIKISLPNQLFPEFKVRDYGFGLSEKEIQNVYAFYGCSTRRESNDAVGQLGFGSKSAFAYGDNFVITSYHNGMKTIYNAIIDPSNIGKISKMYSEPMVEDEKTGIEITIPVKTSDFLVFENKALNFYKYWEVSPKISGTNATLTFKPEDSLIKNSDGWFISKDQQYNQYNNKIIAVMGNVSYPINIDIIFEKNKGENVVKWISLVKCNNLSMVVKFNIGELEVASSRESLQYSQHTIKNIIEKFNKIFDTIVNIFQNEFKNCKNIWEAKCLYQNKFMTYNNPFYGFQDIESFKFEWNGIKISNGKFNDIGHWCNKNGKLTSNDFNEIYRSTPLNEKINPVVREYSYSRRMSSRKFKLKAFKSPCMNICASTESLLVINDTCETQSNVSKAIKVITEKTTGINHLYLFTFTKPGLKEEFFKYYNLDDTPFKKISEVVNKIKNENKKVRKSPTSIAIVKETNLDYQYSYGRSAWREVNVDLKNDGGYYVDIEFNEVRLNGFNTSLNTVYNLVKLLNESFYLKIDTKIYGMNKKNKENKNFKNNSKWINLFDFAKNILDKEKSENYTKYIAYTTHLNVNSSHFNIDLNHITEVYMQIKDKNNPLSLILKDLIDNVEDKRHHFKNISLLNNLIESHQNTTLVNLVEEYKKKFENIFKRYPLLNQLIFVRNINAQNTVDFKDNLKYMCDYINLIDNTVPVK